MIEKPDTIRVCESICLQHRYASVESKDYSISSASSPRKGNCYDNSVMETFFGRMKNEMFYGHEKDFHSFEEFSKAVDEYILYYNNHRIQKKSKWMPPALCRIASIGAS